MRKKSLKCSEYYTVLGVDFENAVIEREPNKREMNG